MYGSYNRQPPPPKEPLTQMQKLLGENYEESFSQYLVVKIILTLLVTLILYKVWVSFAQGIATWGIGFCIWSLLMYALWRMNETWFDS